MWFLSKLEVGTGWGRYGTPAAGVFRILELPAALFFGSPRQAGYFLPSCNGHGNRECPGISSFLARDVRTRNPTKFPQQPQCDMRE